MSLEMNIMIFQQALIKYMVIAQFIYFYSFVWSNDININFEYNGAKYFIRCIENYENMFEIKSQ